MASDVVTVEDASTQSVEAARRGRLYRRLGVVAMVVFLGAGTLGWLGHRQGVVSERHAGYLIEVTYPKIARGGMAANWEVRVQRTDGGPLPPTFEIRSDAGYFRIFDENGLDPEPSSAWSDGSVLTWTFEPDGDRSVLVVSLDARLQPNTRGWFDGTTALYVADRVEVSTTYRTWAVP